MTRNHEKAAYLVDARIKGKGERKFFNIRVRSRYVKKAIFARNVLFVTETGIDNNLNTFVIKRQSPNVLSPLRVVTARGRVRILLATKRVIVGIFDNAQDLDRAVEQLAAAGLEGTAEMRRLAGESA